MHNNKKKQDQKTKYNVNKRVNMKRDNLYIAKTEQTVQEKRVKKDHQ